MKPKKHFLFKYSGLILLVVFTFFTPTLAQDTSVTIYNQGFAVINQSNQISFEQGLNDIKIDTIASRIDPATVSLTCLSAPDMISVLEQNYRYDLDNTTALLNKYIGKNVTVSIKGSGADQSELHDGVLIYTDNQNIVLEISEQIVVIAKNNIEQIKLEKAAADAVTKPTLSWLIDSKQKTDQLCQLTYTTEGISWQANYLAILSEDESKLDLSGQVMIENKSGSDYENAQIKLIAGDVSKLDQPQPVLYRAMATEDAAMPKNAFAEKAFAEYHLYTLPRKTTIKNNEKKQIELIKSAVGISAKNVYIYDRTVFKDKVQKKLEFDNTTKNKLGLALPKGKIRVFKKDSADNTIDFIGENKIDHTPAKKQISLYIGNAFDISVQYTELDSHTSRRMIQQTHKVEITNQKDKPVTVFVDEKFRRNVNWTITESSHKYKKHDAQTARFEIRIPSGSTAEVQYTATQNW